MMYWFRVENPLTFALWLAAAALWWGGGWLLATHAFRLESRERLVIGFGLGLVGYLWFANLLGHFLSPVLTFVGAAFVVLACGLTYAWKGERPLLDWKDWCVRRWIVVGLALLWLFARLARGMAIFDDPKNISIVSTMAAGDIPPHHYTDSTAYFTYHYGFQLLGASLVRLGGLLPWSAFDLSKAIVGAYVLLLAALLGKRYIRHSLGGVVTAGVLAFASGTRYLLLLAPAGVISRIDPLIFVRAPDELANWTLSKAISTGVVISDGPPAPFLFAFMNGIGWPAVMAVHAGPSIMSLVILLLVWLLASRMKLPAAFLVLMVLFSCWAMVWESSYGLFLIAGVAVTFYGMLRRRRLSDVSLKWLTLALWLSFPIVLLQGGTLTEIVRNLLTGLGSSAAPVVGQTFSFAGFSLRWPPAIYSGHLGAIPILSPLGLLVAILELGPVILFTPWITAWAWNQIHGVDQHLPLQGEAGQRLRSSREWVIGALVLSAWIGFIAPIFFSYQFDHDITRFTKHGLLIWTLVLTILLWDQTTGWVKTLRYPAMIGLVLMVFGGVVVAGSELSAAAQELLMSDGITKMDARIAAQTWDTLPVDSEVFDSQSWRATMLTGRLTRVMVGESYHYTRSPEWEQLYQNPATEQLLSAGFRYVYIDERWWAEMPEASRASLSQTCVQLVAESQNEKGNQFRRLVDLGSCQP